MEFEFDPAKSESNQQKHGIGFVEAQQLWQDQDVFTPRQDRIRIISVRRARKNGERHYDGKT